MWKCCFIEPEVAEGSTEGRIGNGQTDDESERKNAVDQNLAVYGLSREFGVEMKWLWVLSQGSE